MYRPNGAIAKTATCCALLQRCAEACKHGSARCNRDTADEARSSRSARTKHHRGDRKKTPASSDYSGGELISKINLGRCTKIVATLK